MKPSKAQRAGVESALSNPYGAVTLICDGRRIDLQVHQFSALRYRVMVYVDGEFRGTWTRADGAAPESKFLRKQVRPVFSPAQKKKMENIYGKRHVAQDQRFSKTLTFYWPDFASGKAALNHLCKVCESVEVAPNEVLTVKNKRLAATVHS